jgi:hypothetical protein
MEFTDFVYPKCGQRVLKAYLKPVGVDYHPLVVRVFRWPLSQSASFRVSRQGAPEKPMRGLKSIKVP